MKKGREEFKQMEILSKFTQLLEFEDPKSTTFILGSSVGLILATYFIKTCIEQRNYFKRLNLPAPMSWPILGNLVSAIRNGLIQNDFLLIKKYGKTVGFYEGFMPVIMTTDLKLIKAFCIKDFGTFVNRRVKKLDF